MAAYPVEGVENKPHLKRAASKYAVMEVFKNGTASLVSWRLQTGRTHQIRVHAQHIGHSIVGDKLYGPDESLFLEFIESGWTDHLAHSLPLNRHALHSYYMEFELESGNREFKAPPSTDLVAFCQEYIGIEISDFLESIPSS